ncbi:glycoside hydrolase family 125 protein [Ktedonosporobacter rubrisoli]|uniref:Glycoside hydrolase family 125 protein n=1 Tax=Ktedonosporobacter rubrisoli TaxID=2509675 RepID=A0A4P6K3E0_KTERU|nr:glycoside hydrolase family 125 protein [Ktedonosporobacter rubrisoli]QBD82555.1 glycoside hydrolase family 125 protein [Ktedonosporobacter rubrisoli]
MQRYKAIYSYIQEIQKKLKDEQQLASMFASCFPNTLETTVKLLDDGTTFVFTGDIPAMWLRDSSAQVNPYIKLAQDDPDLQRLLRGLIHRQAGYIVLDPYANAFNNGSEGQGHKGDRPLADPWVWERKFELDSLCYPVKLCYSYWKATQEETIFNGVVHQMLQKIVATMQVEQCHDQASSYTFERPYPAPQSDTLPFHGKGTRTNYTGMLWSGFRPSDDACKFGFLIPANMFAVVVLGYIEEIARSIYADERLARQAQTLRKEVDFGIKTYGIVEHPRYGRIYAYETDGYGNYNLMDDANVPSLLSMPYLGYCAIDDTLYQNTRRFVLSRDNPYYFAGTYAHGVGSPHTPTGYIWPIALSICGLTTQDKDEQEELLHMLVTTTADSGYMHEGFHQDDPRQFTRPWFAWANSLFAEFVLHVVGSRT